MTRSPLKLRPVAALAAAAMVTGVLAARAQGGDAQTPAATVPAVAAVPKPCARPQHDAPPGQALLDAFAVLRRERAADDALPEAALTALRRNGLRPSVPEAARLLRSTPSGGKAWIVPVPDVTPLLPMACRTKVAPKPREGVAVVATGDAAPGGGGTLADLVRGRAPVSVDPCAGPNHDLVAVSGVVPDGVSAVFLTAPDGTAVRTDVRDNGFELVVPRSRSAAPRYVVWTGQDGTPHVQPVPFVGAVPGRVCRATARRSVPRVTPTPFAPCGIPVVVGRAPRPLPAPARPARPGVASPKMRPAAPASPARPGVASPKMRPARPGGAGSVPPAAPVLPAVAPDTPVAYGMPCPAIVEVPRPRRALPARPNSAEPAPAPVPKQR